VSWFDAADVRLLAKIVVVAVLGSGLVVGAAAVAGAAVRVFGIVAG